jgi:hypothetical protein
MNKYSCLVRFYLIAFYYIPLGAHVGPQKDLLGLGD